MTIKEIKNYLSNCIDKDMYFSLDSYNKQIVLYNYLEDIEKEIKELKTQLQQKENIIKEVREEVKIYEEQSNDGATNELDNYVFVQRLKKILDKGE